MSVKHYVDEVAPASGRVYLIEDAGDGKSTITDVTDYTQAGTPFGASDVQDTCILECNYAKSGTIHQLTTDNTLTANIRFKATARFNGGDAITLNGTTMTAKLCNGSDLPDGCFVENSVVTCYKDGNNLWFDLPMVADSYQQTITLNNNNNTKLICKRNGNIVHVTVQYDNTALGSGRNQIGGSGVIPSAYRPDIMQLSGLIRPVNTANSAITNTSAIMIEINTDGNVYFFNTEALGTGWVVHYTFSYAV